ncbi:MAG: hypothetical protein R3C52_05820 [Hyphomonadaceae bacterium]
MSILPTGAENRQKFFSNLVAAPLALFGSVSIILLIDVISRAAAV